MKRETMGNGRVKKHFLFEEKKEKEEGEKRGKAGGLFPPDAHPPHVPLPPLVLFTSRTLTHNEETQKEDRKEGRFSLSLSLSFSLIFFLCSSEDRG